MSKTSYYPILKWKKGEQCALQNLMPTGAFIPVIELVDECSPAEFFSALNSCYQGPIYFDTLRCDDDERTVLLRFNDYCKKHELKAWPVIYMNDVFTIIEAFATNSIFAVKLPVPEDFNGPSNKEALDVLKKYNSTNKIDLFFDAEMVLSQKEANQAYANYNSLLKNYSDILKDFNKVIICLTSFPEKLDIGAGQSVEYDRFDIKIFQKLLRVFKESDIKSKLAYSDYGVTKFTDSEIDFRLLRYGILPKVKYTTYGSYFVSKGAKDHARGIYTISYKDIANEIINAPFYFGRDFSFGDAEIYQKAKTPTSKTGGPTNWVSYCANHHIAVLIEQLSKILGA